MSSFMLKKTESFRERFKLIQSLNEEDLSVQAYTRSPKPKALISLTKHKLYNVLQGSTHIVADFRPPSDFEECHVHDSYNVPFRIVCEEPMQKSAVKPIPEIRERISQRSCTILVFIVDSFSPKDTGCGTEVEYHQKIADFFYTFAQYFDMYLCKKEIFQEFAHQYPFMCETPTSSHEKPAVCYYPSEVIPGFLYLGNHQHSFERRVVEDLKITHIVNTAGRCKDKFSDELTYLRLELDDHSDQTIRTACTTAFEFIESARQQEGRVLVHCVAGISRSSAIVIAYMMRLRRWSFEQAHVYVRECRPMIDPNSGFKKQLQELESDFIIRNEAEPSPLSSVCESQNSSDFECSSPLSTSS